MVRIVTLTMANIAMVIMDLVVFKVLDICALHKMV